MNRPQERLEDDLSAQRPVRIEGWRKRARGLSLGTAVLVVCFVVPLIALIGFAIQNDLYSHIVLIPFISIYLVWERRRTIPLEFQPARTFACIAAVMGLVLVLAYWAATRDGVQMAREDYLALTVSSFLMFFFALCFVFLGKKTVRALVFPLGFLVFLIPLPVFLSDWIVLELQRKSAWAAYSMFNLVGTPVVFRGLTMQLPDITLEVAPQCSGIHSTLALFITSVLAAYLFLRSPWKGVLLTLAVIPLAIMRNGFRIFTIGELCVHVGPQMINSYIHHHGGPIFFTLSLVPFFLLLYLLSRGGNRSPAVARRIPTP